MKPEKIVFFGLYGQQNIGNDCTLQAILGHARRYFPEAEIKCICTGPEVISARHGISAFPIWVSRDRTAGRPGNLLTKLLRKVLVKIPAELKHWVRALKYLKGSRMLVVAGTGLLVDDTSGPFGFPYHVFKWSVISRLSRCRLLFVSIGAGPILHPMSRKFIKTALSLADYRSYRDSFSKRYISGIGFNTDNDPVYPDLAFSLPDPVFLSKYEKEDAKPVIGVGLIDYRGQGGYVRNAGESIYSEYMEKVVTFVVWLIKNGYKARLIIGDIKYDSSVVMDFLESLEKHDISTESSEVIHEPILSLEQLLEQLNKSDVVISPRFHNIILAVMLNKPVLSISYNEKFDDLMAGFCMEEYCQHIDTLDVKTLIGQLTKIEQRAARLKPLIASRKQEYGRALDEQYSRIFGNTGAGYPAPQKGS